MILANNSCDIVFWSTYYLITSIYVEMEKYIEQVVTFDVDIYREG